MTTSVERELKEIENEIKALKATYAISGSMVETHTLKSDNVVLSDTSTSTYLAIEITFTPEKELQQNALTEMFLVGWINVTMSGQTIRNPTDYVHGTYNDGRFTAHLDVSHSINPDVKFSLEAYAIVSSPVKGAFSYDVIVE